MIFRQVETEDPTVKAIMRNCGSPNVKNSVAYLRVLRFQGGQILAEVADDKAVCISRFGKKHCRLIELAVCEEAHGKGYGSALLSRLVARCRARGLERITFRCSISEGFFGFYVQHGALITGTKDGDYEMEIQVGDYVE